MQFTQRETERMLIYVAAQIARDRKSRGVLLNYPESVAILSAGVLEGARQGKTVADLMEEGCTWLMDSDCMPGVPEMVTEVQVEATFPDGTKLVTLHDPIRQCVREE